MNPTPLLLLLFAIPVLLVIPALYFSAKHQPVQPRPGRPISSPASNPEEDDVATVARILSVAPARDATPANQELLKQALVFSARHCPADRGPAAEFLAKELYHLGIPAVGREIDSTGTSLEDLMALLPGFYARNLDRELVLISLQQGAPPERIHQSFLVVGITPDFHLQPVLRRILGQDWRERMLKVAINQLKPQSA